jgi:GNAT superfamily N-acetyltransferase
VLVAGSPAVGFAALITVDARAHLAALAVHPTHGRRHIGTQLLTAACAEAANAGHTEMTLTTFADVPWNGPWYGARGFIELPADVWGPGLRAVWAAEQAAGIIVAPRIAMIRPLTATQNP